MGFEDVNVGLSIEEIQQKIHDYNIKYFGQEKWLISSTDVGQINDYKRAENKYCESLEKEFADYFKKFGWDKTGNTMRANDTVYVSLDMSNYRLSFEKPNCQVVTYAVRIGSSFKENVNYKLENGKFTHIGGTPTKAEVLKKELDELKSIVEYNDGLNGEYSFHLLVNKEYYNDPIGQGEDVKYDGIVQLLDEISKEEF